jgi:hypothetical protein
MGKINNVYCLVKTSRKDKMLFGTFFFFKQLITIICFESNVNSLHLKLMLMSIIRIFRLYYQT